MFGLLKTEDPAEKLGLGCYHRHVTGVQDEDQSERVELVDYLHRECHQAQHSQEKLEERRVFV